jgi:hypothetical protein
MTEFQVKISLIVDQINFLLRDPKHLFSLFNGLFSGDYFIHSHWLNMLRLEKGDLFCCFDGRWRIIWLFLLLQVHHALDARFVRRILTIHCNWQHDVSRSKSTRWTYHLGRLQLCLSDMRMVKLVIEYALRKHDRVSWAVRTFLIKLFQISPCMATSPMTFLFVLAVVKAFKSFSKILGFYLRSFENFWFLDRLAILC